MKKVLSIAGSDSGAGAGIQQDLKVFSLLKVYGETVVTAVTAQNTCGVRLVNALPPEVVGAQIDAVMEDMRPDAVKTGMLSNTGIIDVVRRKVSEYGVDCLVVDPVMVSTSGHRLLDEEAVSGLKALISDAVLSTPNIHEAEILSGVGIKSLKDMEYVAELLGDCVVKGGHLEAVDVLCYRGRIYHIKGAGKVDVVLHGAGCAFSAAVASYLARGLDVVEAVQRSKKYIDWAVGRNFSIGSGANVLDSGGIKLGRNYSDPERRRVVEVLEEAVDVFVSDVNSFKLVPQVGVNVAMALPEAKSLDDVAGVSGRIVRDRESVAVVGEIVFGGSSHVGRVVLTAMKYDPRYRAAMNVRYSEDIVSICKDLGLRVSSFDRSLQPKDTKTMEWGVSEAVKKFGGVPDVVFDCGGLGKEPMVRVLGFDAVSVVGKVLEVSRLL